MAAESDEQQMLRLKAGEVETLASLVEKYRTPLVHFLYRMVHDAAVAEELAQEVFIRVYRARKSYRPRAKFSTWLFTIATNLALNSLRDGRLRRAAEMPLETSPGEGPERAVEATDPKPTMEQHLLEAERLALIRRAVEELPEKQRLAVLLHKYQELDYAEIADILGCSESALKSLLFRAYEALRVKLRPLLGGRAVQGARQ
ncbi:MAG: sigma-70 family RNA polymerase sigma factor [Acidobacteria bacterium]|nr:sigma-70 family RNA polymerase sigma factor [Acidobacteriota bacterium]